MFGPVQMFLFVARHFSLNDNGEKYQPSGSPPISAIKRPGHAKLASFGRMEYISDLTLTMTVNGGSIAYLWKMIESIYLVLSNCLQ